MKKLTFIISLILLILLGCDDKSKKHYKWTYLIYMAADNGLTQNAINDINEMEQLDNDSNVARIVQIDYSEYNEKTGAYRYKIKQDDDINTISSSIEKNLGEIDSADPYVLANFVNWGFDNYPADNQVLILWSHGNGWNPKNPDRMLPPSFCPDEESNNYLSIREGELREVFSRINHNIDVLVFDACSMQTVEVISEVKSKVSYVIGSEYDVPGDGFPYDKLLTNDLTVEDAVTNFANEYYLSYLHGGSQNLEGENLSITCSAVDIEEFDLLEDELRVFINKYKDMDNYLTFKEIRESLIELNFWNASTDVDLKEFFIKISETDNEEIVNEAQDLLDQISRAFFVQKILNMESDDIGTASIWFPESSVHSSIFDLYESLNFNSTNWVEFIRNFYEMSVK